MKLVAFVIAITALPALAPGQLLWNELTQGDLSDDRFAPTPLFPVLGDNALFGTIDGDDGTGQIDRDYFRITIPAASQLSQLLLTSYDSTDFAAFMGIQPGPIFPDDPDTVLPDDLMGWSLFGFQQVGQDMLPLMAVNGYHFTPPLSEGVYSFWVQQLDTYTEWSADFVVEPAPEPTSAGLLLISGLAFLVRRKKNDTARTSNPGHVGRLPLM